MMIRSPIKSLLGEGGETFHLITQEAEHLAALPSDLKQGALAMVTRTLALILARNDTLILHFSLVRRNEKSVILSL